MTILEVLQNAEYNLNRGLYGSWKANAHPFVTSATQLGLNQLHNAVELLDKGYDLYEEFEEVTAGYAQVEDVPDKDDTSMKSEEVNKNEERDGEAN